MTASDSASPPDRRLNAWRDDLAAEALRGQVEAPRYAAPHAARVIVGTLAVRRAPQFHAMLDTEARFGEAVDIYDMAEGWAWVQLGRDGYVGYVQASGLSPDPLEPTHRVHALSTFVYPEPDIKAPPLLALPLGASVAVARADDRFATLAGGGHVIVRHLREGARHAPDFVDIAERFMGAPYLWGGKTHAGLDCSGLLQVALEAAGIAAPRDSDMQEAALGGSVLIPDNLEGLERGDLVFWPGHVGIMVDGVMLVHANAHHMAVAVEPLSVAAERTARAGSRIRAVKRLAALGARAGA